MLFVPREPFSAALPGLAPPRAVPSDLIVATASRILPADILQKLVLLAIFVLACSGAAALLDREPLLARLAAGVFYTWNPYVAERLIIGHWALLLGYAALPWVLRAVLAPDLVSHRGAARLALALLPAIIGGFAAMAITALLAIPVALLTRNPRRAALTLGALAIGSLPWFIPSLLHQVYVDPASVAAFAARADTPFGSLGSLLMLGGAWNAQTVPTAYGGPWSALWLAAVIVALAAYLLLTRTRPRWPGLAPAALTGLVIAALGVTTPGRDLLRSLIAAFPGFAVLRDAQQFVAPFALLESAGFGLAVAAALNPARFRKEQSPERSVHPDPPRTVSGRPVPADRPRTTSEHPAPAATAATASDRPLLAHPAATASGRPARAGRAGTASDRPVRGDVPRTACRGPVRADPAGTTPERPARVDLAGTLLGVLALLAPVLLLPGLAWGAAGRLRPAWYPATWLSAAHTLDASPAPGSVLLLPWATYRTPSWNHGEVVLDPWTRLLSRPLIWNDGTQVGPVALTPDDPRARSLDAAIDGTGPLTGTLRAVGVRFVLDDANGPQPQLATRLPGSVMIINLPGLTVYQLPG
ncbi:MAG TPA: hypothetical protein VGS06_14000 [Streptosporangiaceae bacterium]|nr:hypothetical protein [Streptosporangiaceae bacterium]